jgi:peptidoglycan/xylan/chitin deacetylase (PgdA/CDA1 family)
VSASAAGCDSGATPSTRAQPTSTTKPSSGSVTGSGSGGAPAPSRALPAEVVNGPRDQARVALTFHGQGDPTIVKQLLTELESGQAHVTVLAVGSWLDAQPALAKLILDGGHDLGNHTQNHAAIASMNATQALAEIQACADRLRRLSGSIGTWFRPSQTQHATPLIRAQAAKVGYPTCLSYDVDSLDYTDPGAAAVTRNTLRSVQNGSIISLHFGHAGTVAAMPQMLDGLRQRGLKAVTMTELMS